MWPLLGVYTKTLYALFLPPTYATRSAQYLIQTFFYMYIRYVCICYASETFKRFKYSSKLNIKPEKMLPSNTEIYITSLCSHCILAVYTNVYESTYAS